MTSRKSQETDNEQQSHVSAVGRGFVEGDNTLEDERGGKEHGEAVG